MFCENYSKSLFFMHMFDVFNVLIPKTTILLKSEYFIMFEQFHSW